MTTTEDFRNEAWRVAHAVHDVARRMGLLGPLDPLLLRLAPLVIPPSSVEMEADLPFGLRLAVPARFPSARSLASGVYEPEVTQLLQETLKEGMGFVDLGANIGYYTVIGSRLVGELGHVYAFEPDPRNYAYLQRNISTSALPNVVAVEKAATDRTGLSAFVRDQAGAEGWLGTGKRGADQITVQTTTLDDFFSTARWPDLHVVKMDIEGAEKAALDGMRELVRRNCLTLIVELNRGALERAGTLLDEFAELLAGLGYRQGRIIERRMKPFSLPNEIPRSRTTCNLFLQPEAAKNRHR